MRYKFIILFLLIGFVSKAQVYQLMPQYGYSTYRMNFDSTIQIPTFCGVPRLGSNVTKKGAIAFDSCNNRFYYFNPKFQSWDTIKTADASLFVKYTDTSTMLNAYLRKADTTNKFVNSVVKVNDSTFRVFKGATSTDITLVGNTGIATKLTTTAYNKSGALIPKGSVVYIDGAHSSLYPSIALAKANNEETSAYTYGLVENDISNNSLGVVVQVGSITNLNLPTSSFTDGQTLYLSPTVAGGYTTTKPLAPNHYVAIGTVIRAHPNFGTIQIAIRNGFQLDEMSDVKISLVPLDSTILQFSRVDSLWHDVDPTTAMGNRFVKRTDSASMLLPYIRNAGYGLTKSSQSLIADSLLLSTRAWRQKGLDSLARLELSISDTAAMLSVYQRIGTGANIYNTNGSLTGARTLTLNSQPLTFLGSTDATSTRIHANGNVTIGGTTSPNTDSVYKFTVSGTGNVMKIRMRQGFTGQDINFIQNDVYNLISTGGVFQIGSTTTTASFGAGTGGTTFIGCNAQDVVSRVTIGNATFQAGNASSMLDINSTTRGFLQPRMTTTQMNAISTPAIGLSVFNTTDSVPYTYRGTRSGWQKNVIYNRNNDVALFNGADQRIMIDTTTNVVAGRSLTVEAGSTITQGTSIFAGLGQTSRNWIGMAAISNGDIYVSVLGGDIYKRTGGTGNFVALGQTTRNWYYMAAAPNNDVYACVLGGDIYKQTGGIGNFVALGQTSRNWYAMCAAPNGDVYASVSNGDIYKQTGGTGNFIALGQTTRNWQSMAAAPNGDIYAAEPNGDIYKQTGGTGNFIALSQTTRLWQGMTAASNGDIYINVSNGDIYKQTGGIGNFVALNQTSRNWGGMTQSSNGDIYAAAFGGDIFIQGAGTSNLNGGSLVLQSGVGKGTGTSTINFNTGTTLASGATLQTVSTKMTILGNGNVGIGTTSPSAKLELSDTAKGFLQTRMTTTQRNNISSPSVGLQVFTTTDSSQYVYRGTGAGWQQLANEIVNTGTLDFPSTNAQNSSDLTITLTGAVDGDAVVLGVPNAAVNANSCYTAWVSAANAVTVRFNNYSSGAINPASATFKVTIIK